MSIFTRVLYNIPENTFEEFLEPEDIIAMSAVSQIPRYGSRAVRIRDMIKVLNFHYNSPLRLIAKKHGWLNYLKDLYQAFMYSYQRNSKIKYIALVANAIEINDRSFLTDLLIACKDICSKITQFMNNYNMDAYDMFELEELVDMEPSQVDEQIMDLVIKGYRGTDLDSSYIDEQYNEKFRQLNIFKQEGLPLLKELEESYSFDVIQLCHEESYNINHVYNKLAIQASERFNPSFLEILFQDIDIGFEDEDGYSIYSINELYSLDPEVRKVIIKYLVTDIRNAYQGIKIYHAPSSLEAYGLVMTNISYLSETLYKAIEFQDLDLFIAYVTEFCNFCPIEYITHLFLKGCRPSKEEVMELYSLFQGFK